MKTVGFPRITQTCAICHAASYRTSPDAEPVIVPTGPSHTTNAMAFLDFLEAAANDPRWSGDGMMPEIERNFDLGVDDKLMYRYLIIPLAKDRVLQQAADFSWIHAHDRPAWGPGRDGPFNLTKFNLLRLPDDGTVDNADFPAIWNAGPARGDVAELGRGDAGSAGGLHRLGARDRSAAGDRHRGYGEASRVLAGEAAAALPLPDRRGAGGAGGGGVAAGVCRVPCAGGRVFRADGADRGDRDRPGAVRYLDAGGCGRDQRQGAGDRGRAEGDGEGRGVREPAAGRHLAAGAVPAQRLGAVADRASDAAGGTAGKLLARLRYLRSGRGRFPQHGRRRRLPAGVRVRHVASAATATAGTSTGRRCRRTRRRRWSST